MNDKEGTPGGLPPEPVEERENVGSVRPEDYPERDRARLEEDRDAERLEPGNAGNTPSGPDSGRQRDLA